MTTTKKSKKSEPATTQIVGRRHMKVDKVDFSRVSALNKISLVEFQATILAMTKLSDAYGNTKKRLDGNIAVVRSNAELFNRPLNDEEKDKIHAWRVELDRETVKPRCSQYTGYIASLPSNLFINSKYLWVMDLLAT